MLRSFMSEMIRAAYISPQEAAVILVPFRKRPFSVAMGVEGEGIVSLLENQILLYVLLSGPIQPKHRWKTTIPDLATLKYLYLFES